MLLSDSNSTSRWPRGWHSRWISRSRSPGEDWAASTIVTPGMPYVLTALPSETTAFVSNTALWLAIAL